MNINKSKPLNSLVDDADDILGKAVGPLPKSSRINFPKEEVPISEYDLWIVGAGTIGQIIAKQWKEKFPNDIIVAETRTPNRHNFYNDIGVIPKLRGDRTSVSSKKAKNVIISIPPSGKSDNNTYIEELTAAYELWAGPLGGGSMIFTSSIAVYGESLGNTVDENFRLDLRSQKSTSMIAAEESILSRGGAVVRLAGLYTSTRGPHSYWLTIDKVDGAADGLINLIHYEDAASIVLLASQYNAGKVSPSIGGLVGSFQQVFLGSDNKPISRRDICLAALDSGLYPNAKLPQFSSESGPSDNEIEEEKKSVKSLSSLWMPGDDIDNLDLQL
eukprot:gene17849-23462_t